MAIEALLTPQHVWQGAWLFVTIGDPLRDLRSVRVNGTVVGRWKTAHAVARGGGRVGLLLFEADVDAVDRIEADSVAGPVALYKGGYPDPAAAAFARRETVALVRFVIGVAAKTRTEWCGDDRASMVRLVRWLRDLCDQGDRAAFLGRVGSQLLFEAERLPAGRGEICGFAIVSEGLRSVRLTGVVGTGRRLAGLTEDPMPPAIPTGLFLATDRRLAFLALPSVVQRDVAALRERLKAYSRADRAVILRAVSRSPGPADGDTASNAPAVTRLLMAEPRPFIDPGLGVFAAIDLMIPGPSGAVLAGRFADLHGLIEGLEIDLAGRAITVELRRFGSPSSGAIKSIHGRLGRCPPRPWFASHVSLPRSAIGLPQVSARLRLRGGLEAGLVSAPAPRSPREARGKLLRLVPEQEVDAWVIGSIWASTVGVVQQQLVQTVRPAAEHLFGCLPASPAVSVVIPLYRNLSYLKHQVFHFALDPDFREAEVIFVLDSPEQEGEVVHALRGLAAQFRFSCRLIVMSSNGGYAVASNAGATAASADLLLMLNSDVIPEQPGWLSAAVRQLRQDQQVGALGVKLLHADGALQHAGMYFENGPFGWWINRHFYKGLPNRIAAADALCDVPAVTGACLFVPRSAFEAVGGFTTDYVVGDFEDSDLCLKLRAAGYSIRYFGGVQLYHFERSSIAGHAEYSESAASRYNGWLQTQRWHREIAALMAAEPRADELVPNRFAVVSTPFGIPDQPTGAEAA